MRDSALASGPVTLVQGVVQAQVSAVLRSYFDKDLERGPVSFPSWTSSVRIRSPAVLDGRCQLKTAIALS